MAGTNRHRYNFYLDRTLMEELKELHSELGDDRSFTMFLTRGLNEYRERLRDKVIKLGSGDELGGW